MRDLLVVTQTSVCSQNRSLHELSTCNSNVWRVTIEPEAILNTTTQGKSMFIDELTPLFKQLTQHPVSFLGGFASGMLRLSMHDDPVKSWLNQQGSTYMPTIVQNGKSAGPQSISID